MSWPSHPDSFAAQRERMVRTQLVERGIDDPRVLGAFGVVPREEFVPESLRDQAYDDRPLPIGCGQTISQPYIVAVMLQRLTLQPHESALEIGTGSGYAAALLSRLCAEIYSVERHAELGTAAATALARLGYSNVHVRTADGTVGLPECAPFDAILVSAAAATLPPALFGQIREGGRIIVPIGSPSAQDLHLIRKVEGQPLEEVFEACRFVPLMPGTASSTSD